MKLCTNVDPDNLYVDREEVLKNKLHPSDGTVLLHPYTQYELLPTTIQHYEKQG